MAGSVHTAIPTGVERVAEGPEKGSGKGDGKGDERNPGYLGDEAQRLTYVRDALRTGKNYQELTIDTWSEQHRSLVDGEHPANSKYRTAAYGMRSRLFRPKIPQMVLRHTALANDALFGSVDVATVEAEDSSNPNEVAGAKLRGGLLNWHLRPEGPAGWFDVALGGYVQAQTDGVVCGKMEWLYSKDEGGNVVEDRLDPDLIRPEYLLFDPGASWKDPVGTSPWVVEIIPMRVDEIEERMNEDMDEEEGRWRYYDRSVIRSASSLPTMKMGSLVPEEAKQDAQTLTEHDRVYVLKVIKREGGRDYYHYQLGETWPLTEPEPLEKLHLGGERPYVVGHCTIEPFELYKKGPVKKVKHLQFAITDLMNLRMDKIRLAVAGRFLTRRGAHIGSTFERAHPGDSIEVDNPNTDVRELQVASVDRGAFEEGDRLAAEFDDTAGVMNAGTVQSQRNLNETVGGMNLMSQGVDLLSKLQLTVYTISFIYKMLEKAANLIGHYETDKLRIMNIAKAEGVAGSEEEGEDQGMALFNAKADLKENFRMRMSVGSNATNPTMRIQKLVFALQNILQISPNSMGRLKADEIEKEIMGCAGYSDAGRFFMKTEEAPPEDPMSNPDVLKAALAYSQHRETLGLDAQKAAVDARLRSQDVQAKLMQIAAGAEGSKEKLQVEVQKFIAQLQADEKKMLFETQIEQPNPRLA